MRFYTTTHQYYCGIDLHARVSVARVDCTTPGTGGVYQWVDFVALGGIPLDRKRY